MRGGRASKQRKPLGFSLDCIKMDIEAPVYYELEEEVPRFLFSSRFALAVLGFFGFVAMSTQRACMNVVMVCMLNQTGLAVLAAEKKTVGEFETNHTQPLEVPCDQRSIELLKHMINKTEMEFLFDGDFLWNETKQNVIYSTFYWGYLLSQIPCGFLATRFGGKRVFGFFLLTSSISTGLIPFGTETHYYILIFLRFVGGVGAGAAFPAMGALWGKWAPPMERTKLACMSYAGALTGAIITFPLTVTLCELGILGGWPCVFYVVGGGGVAWFIIWMLFASESPLDHGRISREEKQYIVVTLTPETNLHTGRPIKIPWINVVTSIPFISLVICHFTYEWGMYTLGTSVPQFLHENLNIDLKYNSLFSVLPYLGMWLLTLICGACSDRLIVRGVIVTTTTRKIMEGIGTIIPIGMLVGTGFITCAQWKGAVSVQVIGIAFCGFRFGGFLVSHLDIAPQYAGVLMGIANGIGTTASFIAPFIVDIITQENTREQWQTVFFIAASFLAFGMLAFLICGSGDIQSWARPIDDEDADEEHDPIGDLLPLANERYIKVPPVAGKPIKLVPQNKVQPQPHIQVVQPVGLLPNRNSMLVQNSNTLTKSKPAQQQQLLPANRTRRSQVTDSPQASTSRDDSASHDFSISIDSLDDLDQTTTYSSTSSEPAPPTPIPAVKKAWSKWSKKSSKSNKSTKSSKSTKSNSSNKSAKGAKANSKESKTEPSTSVVDKDYIRADATSKNKDKSKRLSQMSVGTEGSDFTIEDWKFYDTLSESIV